jgi:hypothetical protein
MSVIPALVGQREEDHDFEAGKGYIVKSCLKNKNQIN